MHSSEGCAYCEGIQAALLLLMSCINVLMCGGSNCLDCLGSYGNDSIEHLEVCY